VVDPPPLPHHPADVTLVTAIGTLAWVLGAVGLFVAHLVAGRPLDIWFTTCVAGAALGGFGFGVFRWQRAAARRGSRLAQRGLDD
jgi:hypothetical protein